MIQSKLTIIWICTAPFILWMILGPLWWEAFQFEMSLMTFSGIFNTFYFLGTTIYFLFLFLYLWVQSLEGAE